LSTKLTSFDPSELTAVILPSQPHKKDQFGLTVERNYGGTCHGGGRIDFLWPCIRPRFTVTRGSDATKQQLSEASAALDVVLIPDDKVFVVTWLAIVAPCVPEDNDVEEVRIKYEKLPQPEVVQ
jgi:hypothetical protein